MPFIIRSSLAPLVPVSLARCTDQFSGVAFVGVNSSFEDAPRIGASGAGPSPVTRSLASWPPGSVASFDGDTITFDIPGRYQIRLTSSGGTTQLVQVRVHPKQAYDVWFGFLPHLTANEVLLALTQLGDPAIQDTECASATGSNPVGDVGRRLMASHIKLGYAPFV